VFCRCAAAAAVVCVAPAVCVLQPRVSFVCAPALVREACTEAEAVASRALELADACQVRLAGQHSKHQPISSCTDIAQTSGTEHLVRQMPGMRTVSGVVRVNLRINFCLVPAAHVCICLQEVFLSQPLLTGVSVRQGTAEPDAMEVDGALAEVGVLCWSRGCFKWVVSFGSTWLSRGCGRRRSKGSSAHAVLLQGC
jgi:hypothetical protein